MKFSTTFFSLIVATGAALALPVANSVDSMITPRQASLAANPAEVLAKKDLESRNSKALAEDAIIIIRVTSSAYDEDVAAADPAEVLGIKAA